MRQFPCAGCGATVEFAPGTNALRCPYCGHTTLIEQPPDRAVREHDWAQFAGLPRKPIALLAANVYVCGGCGAQTESDTVSDRCRFCGAPVVAQVDPADQVVPEAVLPFTVDQRALRTALGAWVASRWFAPSGLKKVGEAESAKSTYLPHWTYDSRTVSQYEGQRGDHYYVTETYTSNGRPAPGRFGGPGGAARPAPSPGTSTTSWSPARRRSPGNTWTRSSRGR